MSVRLHLILFPKITGAFLFRIFGGFFHVPTTQIYCLTGAIISETHIIIITRHNTKRSSTIIYFLLKYSLFPYMLMQQEILHSFVCLRIKTWNTCELLHIWWHFLCRNGWYLSYIQGFAIQLNKNSFGLSPKQPLNIPLLNANQTLGKPPWYRTVSVKKVLKSAP